MKKILVIDDEAGLVEVCKLVLELEGYLVSVAYGGMNGVAEAKRTQPDLIFLDWVMPDINGGEVFKQLHADPSTNSIPVVFMSALAEVKYEGRILGANNFLPKPFNVEKLLKLVSTTLAQKKPRHAA